MIPGINLFNVASTVISTILIPYYPYVTRTQDAAKNWVSVYGDVINVRASVQAVPRSKYAFSGLDFQKYYVKIFVPYNSIDLSRDTSGDKFVFGGDTFIFESNNEWYDMDGWSSAYAIRTVKGTS